MPALGLAARPVSVPSSSIWNQRLLQGSTTGVPLHWSPSCCGVVLCRNKVPQVPRCTASEASDEDGWSIEGQVEKLLGEEESKALIQDLNAAVERVAKARRELDDFEQQQQRSTSLIESLNAADSLVEECQRGVFAAELEAKNAEIALIKARAGRSMMDLEEEVPIDRDAERVESGKAAGVAGVVGTLAGLPFFSATNLDMSELAASAGIVFVSGCVFGLTYRYAVRRDLRNTQLKAGCVAAFSLVRSLDAVRLLITMSPQDGSQQLLQGCSFFAESIAVFAFAAVGLEYCFRQGFVSPFPSKPR